MSFNSRARVGRDGSLIKTGAVMTGFNSRARVGRDRILSHDYKYCSWFQLTRPCGARHIRAAKKESYALVSTHAPVWGATCAVFRYPHISSGFNSRARVGRDLIEWMNEFCTEVSTHAPVWGATWSMDNFKPIYTVSTHAPVWGATR